MAFLRSGLNDVLPLYSLANKGKTGKLSSEGRPFIHISRIVSTVQMKCESSTPIWITDSAPPFTLRRDRQPAVSSAGVPSWRLARLITSAH